MRAKWNKGFDIDRSFRVDQSLDLPEDKISRGTREYTDWHWGLAPKEVMDWDDPDYPEMLIMCGRLVRVHFRAPRSLDRHPRRDRDTMIELSKRATKESFVAYDPDHKYQRLYLLLPDYVCEFLAERFWDQNRAQPMNLNDAAHVAGGRHAMADYPDVEVKPVGALSAIVYMTNKKGDGLSPYIHHMGEVSNHMPFLCVDETGRLWIAGSNYTTPTPGVTD